MFGFFCLNIKIKIIQQMITKNNDIILPIDLQNLILEFSNPWLSDHESFCKQILELPDGSDQANFIYRKIVIQRYQACKIYVFLDWCSRIDLVNERVKDSIAIHFQQRQYDYSVWRYVDDEHKDIFLKSLRIFSGPPHSPSMI